MTEPFRYTEAQFWNVNLENPWTKAAVRRSAELALERTGAPQAIHCHAPGEDCVSGQYGCTRLEQHDVTAGATFTTIEDGVEHVIVDVSPSQPTGGPHDRARP